jgi:hypothetical protein
MGNSKSAYKTFAKISLKEIIRDGITVKSVPKVAV